MPVVDGHSITITHPDKVLFPDDGITKADLADYYLRIADRMLPHVRHRPLNRNAYAQTIVAPYSVRARRGAPIALPVAWSDVERKDLRADGVTMRTVWKWLANREDPWQSMDQARRPLPSLKDSERPDRSGRRCGTTKEQRARRATAAVSTKH